MNDYQVKDSGERQKFDTGAQRDTQVDKPRYDLIPSKALERLAFVYAKGAEKYDENNWMKGIPVTRTLASAERHLQQWKQGDRDEDHLAQAVWNLFAIMHYEAYPQFYEHLYDQPNFTRGTLAEALGICTECAKKLPEHEDDCPLGGSKVRRKVLIDTALASDYKAMQRAERSPLYGLSDPMG